ncbi:cell surface glycoprotein MUC18 [Nematolebias whitei]|uniref:cell surface glycoprotein MUC18 n=1 Tax=Nematolebias whitei TaxID=451745 RepID=UPI00189BB04F|nr:cell surface glycoprotein MUC18 [Nematolebias whitei]
MTARTTSSLLAGLLLLFHTWRVWADVEVTMKDKVEVYLGDTAQITCKYTSDDGSGGTFIEWFYVTRSGDRQIICERHSFGTTVSKNTLYTNRISMNDTETPGELVLTISDVQVEDDVEFICKVRGFTDGSTEGSTKLRVFAKPGLPTIEGVQTGISVSEDVLSKIGTCMVKNGYPKPNITWYRNNVPLRSSPNVVDVVSSVTTESSSLLSVKSELRLKVQEEDKDAKFYCEVTYFVPGATKMTETPFINVNVLYPSTAVNMWVESPTGKIKEGDSVELHCKGNGNSPSSISIKHTNSEALWEGDMVVLKNVTRLNSGEYECSLMDMDTYDEISGNTTVFVNYLDPAVLKPSETIVVAQGYEIKATCNALASLSTETTWFKNGQKVSKGHSLILKDATFDTAGTYVCVISVSEIEGLETSSSLHVHVKGPPEMKEKAINEIETFEKTVDLSCHVRGYPAPKITWTTADGKVIKAASETQTEVGSKSVVTVQVTSDSSVFCNASNELGTDGVTFNIKAKLPLHTTTPTTTTTTTSTIPKASETPNTSKKIEKESNGVIIAVIIICILLLAILGSVLYFLYKKGKICNRSGKQDITRERSSKDNIVVEMKSDNTEEAILLGVNGEKQARGEQ